MDGWRDGWMEDGGWRMVDGMGGGIRERGERAVSQSVSKNQPVVSPRTNQSVQSIHSPIELMDGWGGKGILKARWNGSLLGGKQPSRRSW